MEKYNSIARKLHWTSGLIIISLLIAGFIMTELPKSPMRNYIYYLHKSFGVMIILIMFVRILWKIQSKSPQLRIAKWQKTSAHITHGLLYITALLMPTSGLLMSISHGYPPNVFGLFTINFPATSLIKPYAKIFSNTHYYTGWILTILIAIHIIAAFSHGLGKNGIIWRMWNKNHNQ
jgi:cytochrome b561